MIVIADSGSTKTDWRILEGGKEIINHYTHGFNPYIQTTEDITSLLQRELCGKIPYPEAITDVYFYGAGCSNQKNNESVATAINSIFPTARVTVSHDLIAAARAACGREPGIAAILGTGSNSCYYDGETIVEHVESLGFILGDEGSGAYIGKKLVQAYLYKQLPQSLAEKFDHEYKMNKEMILEAVYKKPFPNRFLASLTKFVKDNIENSFTAAIVESSFEDFFTTHICKYSRYKEVPMNCVGSVGLHFKDILIAVAEKKGVIVNKVLDSPIEGLVDYHLSQHQNC